MAEKKRMPMTRQRLAGIIAAPEINNEQLFSCGMLLLLMACAKKGDTLLESIDLMRASTAQGESWLYESWDQLRKAK